MNTCENCRWFAKDHHEPEQGECRAVLPVVSVVPRSGWPATHESDWCKHHLPQGEEGKLILEFGDISLDKLAEDLRTTALRHNKEVAILNLKKMLSRAQRNK